MLYNFSYENNFKFKTFFCMLHCMTSNVKKSVNPNFEKKYLRNTARYFKVLKTKYVVFKFIIQSITHS